MEESGSEGNREEARRERRGAEKIHLERNEREREKGYIWRGYHDGELEEGRERIVSYEFSKDDTHTKQPVPKKKKNLNPQRKSPSEKNAQMDNLHPRHQPLSPHTRNGKM